MHDLKNVLAPMNRPADCLTPVMSTRRCSKVNRTPLFRNNWAAIGFGKDTSEPGMVKPVTFLGIPMIMVRNGMVQSMCFRMCASPGHDPCRETAEVARADNLSLSCLNYDLMAICAGPLIGGPGIDTLDSVNIAIFR